MTHKKPAIFIVPRIKSEDEFNLKQELAQALTEMESGNIIGPFNTIDKLKDSLEK